MQLEREVVADWRSGRGLAEHVDVQSSRGNEETATTWGDERSG